MAICSAFANLTNSSATDVVSSDVKNMNACFFGIENIQLTSISSAFEKNLFFCNSDGLAMKFCDENNQPKFFCPIIDSKKIKLKKKHQIPFNFALPLQNFTSSSAEGTLSSG